MKRIGYIGLSTPIYYDYKNMASKTQADVSSSPNPILEGAFGAMLLYDELWFLTRSLCPENMRNLNYVKFLDELNQVPDVDPKWLANENEVFNDTSILKFRESSKDYQKVKEESKIYWDAAADNHTHQLNIGKLSLNGSSWNLNNVMYDMLMVERLPYNVELITNSFSSRLFASESNINNQLNLTEILILDSVPQFITPKGPYHSCIEEVRESSFLTYFRKWIQDEALNASSKDITEIKKEIDTKLQESQNNLFLKHLNPKGIYSSTAQTLLSTGVDALIPGVSAVKELMGNLNTHKQKNGTRWQGFIVDARNKVQIS